MLVVEGDILRSLQRKTPVVDLIDERSPDESSNDRKSYGRVVPDHVHHLDPRSTCPLPPVLDDPRYIVGAGADTSVRLGAFLELILIIANIGTAVVLWPVLKRVNEILALGFVTARIVECAFIAVGILSLLTLVTLRQEAAAGADASSLVTAGESLVALHDWTFLFGPGFVVGVGNGLILGYLMYRSALVPRAMAVLGLVGGPLIIASGIAVLLGPIEQGGPLQLIVVIPEFLWELSLGL
jgi:hypothetical protein